MWATWTFSSCANSCGTTLRQVFPSSDTRRSSLDLLKIISYYPNGKSTTWGINRAYTVFIYLFGVLYTNQRYHALVHQGFRFEDMGVSVEEMENMLKPPLRQHLPGNKKGGKEGEFCGKAKYKPSPKSHQITILMGSSWHPHRRFFGLWPLNPRASLGRQRLIHSLSSFDQQLWGNVQERNEAIQVFLWLRQCHKLHKCLSALGPWALPTGSQPHFGIFMVLFKVFGYGYGFLMDF